MKKLLFAILIILLLGFSVMAAEDDKEKDKLNDSAATIAATTNQQDTTAEPTLTSAEDDTNEDDKEKDDESDDSSDDEDDSREGDRRGRFARLRNEEANRINELREEQIERLVEIKAERLRKIARNLNQANLERIADLDREQLSRLASLGRERFNEFVQLSNTELRARLANVNIKRVRIEFAFNMRQIATENLMAARERYQEAKREFQEAKRRFREARANLLEAKEEGDEAAVLEYLKEYLINAADSIINQLKQIAERTNENEGIDEAEAEEILLDIESRISLLGDAKSQVEAATTIDEVKEAGKVIADAWKKISKRIKQHIAHLVRAKVGEIVKRSEHLETKLEKALADMIERGIDVEDIDAKVDLFSQKIAEARDKFSESQKIFQQAKTGAEADIEEDTTTDEEVSESENLVKQARELAKEAHKALKEAHEILMEIVKEIRQAGGDADEIEEENEDEEIEVVEIDEEDEEETEGGAENE